MKKAIALMVFFVVIAVYSVSAQDSDLVNQSRKKPGSSVGAPLDGGLLTVLGAAGVAYLVARKKKKSDL